VWCTPYFDTENAFDLGAKVPPSSCPRDLFVSLAEDVARDDRHSLKIRTIKDGILRGAEFKLRSGVITAPQFEEIKYMLQAAQTSDFVPLLYVIPFDGVRNLARSVPVGARAHPLSNEILIEALPRSCFGIIRF
jgi:hypothetical protein